MRKRLTFLLIPLLGLAVGFEASAEKVGRNPAATIPVLLRESFAHDAKLEVADPEESILAGGHAREPEEGPAGVFHRMSEDDGNAGLGVAGRIDRLHRDGTIGSEAQGRLRQRGPVRDPLEFARPRQSGLRELPVELGHDVPSSRVMVTGFFVSLKEPFSVNSRIF